MFALNYALKNILDDDAFTWLEIGNTRIHWSEHPIKDEKKKIKK